MIDPPDSVLLYSKHDWGCGFQHDGAEFDAEVLRKTRAKLFLEREKVR